MDVVLWQELGPWTPQGEQVLDAVASILASGEFVRDDALGAAEAMLGVVPDDARARDCSAGALRAGVAAARAAANVIADSDSSIPELCELLAKIDERVSACAQQVEGLMPWWSDLQREVAEKKEQIRRAAQLKLMRWPQACGVSFGKCGKPCSGTARRRGGRSSCQRATLGRMWCTRWS